MSTNATNITQAYLAATAQLQKILDSFTADRSQKDAAEEALADLTTALGAYSVQRVEGRTALLTALIVEMNDVIEQIRINPIGDTLAQMNGIIGTANRLLAGEKQVLRQPMEVSTSAGMGVSVMKAERPRTGLSESYIVRVGDSLVNLAAHFGMSLAALRNLNPQLSENETIATGNVIRVPQATPQDPSIHGTAVARSDYPWYELAKREMETGVAETPGPGDNPRIIEFHKSTNLSLNLADHDETPWCSSFVNWCVEQSGHLGTNSARAKTWLNWGAKLEMPREGCIVILNRTEDPAKGHVGFYVGENDGHIQILGGNQNNAINVSPFSKSRLAGYRWI